MNVKEILKILATARFKFRSDTFENWQEKNPILLSGEFGVVTNGAETDKVKIGDGVTPWNNLSWWRGSKGEKGDEGADYVLTEEDKLEIVGMVDLSNYYTKKEVDNIVGDIETALDELHNYAQALINGGV